MAPRRRPIRSEPAGHARAASRRDIAATNSATASLDATGHDPPPGIAATTSPDANRHDRAAGRRVLVIGCGALVRELQHVSSLNHHDHLEVECLPAALHNRPERIPEAVRERVRRARASGAFRTIVVGYMDCGTGGLLDKVCAAEGVERLPGAHCYELFSGADAFAEFQKAEPGTFYLTDYMVRHFDRLIMHGLGIAEHPQLLEMYFGNYTRVIHLAQTHDEQLARSAEQAAAKLGLRCERVFTGIGGLGHAVVDVARRVPAAA